MRRNRTTRSGEIKSPDDRRRRRRRRGAGVRRTLRALGRLARARGRVNHVPTRMQVRAMAYFDGREPSSYLLDPAVNFVPELPLGDPDSLGRHALRFTGEDAGSGRRVELVAVPDGGAFDLLGMSGQPAAPSLINPAGIVAPCSGGIRAVCRSRPIKGLGAGGEDQAPRRVSPLG